ncbi:MAG: hypothetical protein JST16_08465 [Bdellovibrionales bacterium]|nr:hypothetical protein [Bdellovibrionales bacterium]
MNPARWLLWSKILLWEGLILAGIGFGWALGTRAGPSLMPTFVLVGIGTFGFIAGLLLWNLISRTIQQRSASSNFMPIDLDEHEKSIRQFNGKTTLIDTPFVQSQLYQLTRTQRVLNLATPVLVEHWGGEDIEVVAAREKKSMGPREILRVEALPGAESIDISLVGNTGEAFVLVHVLYQNKF